MVTRLNTAWLLPSAIATYSTAVVFAIAGLWKWAVFAVMPLAAMMALSGISILTEKLLGKEVI